MNGSGVSSKLFILGIALGVTGGIVIGSVIGMQFGQKSALYLKKGLEKVVKPKHDVRFDLLLQ